MILWTLKAHIPPAMRATLYDYAVTVSDANSFIGGLLREAALHQHCTQGCHPTSIQAHYRDAHLQATLLRYGRHHQDTTLPSPQTLVNLSPTLSRWLADRCEEPVRFSWQEVVMAQLSVAIWTLLYSLRQIIPWCVQQLTTGRATSTPSSTHDRQHHASRANTPSTTPSAEPSKRPSFTSTTAAPNYQGDPSPTTETHSAAPIESTPQRAASSILIPPTPSTMSQSSAPLSPSSGGLFAAMPTTHEIKSECELKKAVS